METNNTGFNEQTSMFVIGSSEEYNNIIEAISLMVEKIYIKNRLDLVDIKICVSYIQVGRGGRLIALDKLSVAHKKAIVKIKNPE